LGLKLEGDTRIAASWIPWANSRLAVFKEAFGDFNKFLPMNNAEITISSMGGIDDIRIKGKGGSDFMVYAYVGDTTAEYSSARWNTRYYKLAGENLKEIDSAKDFGWSSFKDDGLYGIASFSPDYTTTKDPWAGINFKYKPTGGGLNGTGIPALGFNVDAKKVSGSSARVVLGTATETPAFQSVRYSSGGVEIFRYLTPFNSLTSFTFNNFYPFGFNAGRYVEDGFLVAISQLGEADGLQATLKGIGGGDYYDQVSSAYRIYFVNMEGEKSFFELPADESGDSAVVTSSLKPNKKRELSYIRARTKDVGYGAGVYRFTSIDEEVASLDSGEILSSNEIPDTSRGPMGSKYISGRYGQSTLPIHDLVKLPFGYGDDGKMTFIQIEKDSDFTWMKSSVYLADKLIEESRREESITLFQAQVDSTTDTSIKPSVGPIKIHKTKYAPQYAYHGAKYNACVFSKTTYVSHVIEDTVLKDGKIPLYWITGSVYCPVKTVTITSDTEFYLAVNGEHTKIPSGYRMEEKVLVVDTLEQVPFVTGVHQQILTIRTAPWYDIPDAGQTQVSRCMFSEAGGKLLAAIDIYDAPVVKHDVENFTQIFGITPNYNTDDSGVEFPPYIDLRCSIADRKWWLFSGSDYIELETPKDYAGNHMQRVCGVSLLEKKR
jgi:hypothetical protein